VDVIFNPLQTVLQITHQIEQIFALGIGLNFFFSIGHVFFQAANVDDGLMAHRYLVPNLDK
jgi:hypothetical protein